MEFDTYGAALLYLRSLAIERQLSDEDSIPAEQWEPVIEEISRAIDRVYDSTYPENFGDCSFGTPDGTMLCVHLGEP